MVRGWQCAGFGGGLCVRRWCRRECPQSSQCDAITVGWVSSPQTPSQVHGPGRVPQALGPWFLACEVGTGQVTGKG